MNLTFPIDFMRSQSGEQREILNFEKKNEGYFKLIMKSLPIRASMAPGMELAGTLVFALAVFAINRGYWGEELSPSTLGTFFITLGILLKPMRNFGDQLSRWYEVKGALETNFAEISLTKPTTQKKCAPTATNFFPTKISEFACGYENDAVVRAV